MWPDAPILSCVEVHSNTWSITDQRQKGVMWWFCKRSFYPGRCCCCLWTNRILCVCHSIGGHRVRRGTRVLVNMWSIHHDPEHWDKPDLFNPGKQQTPRHKCLSLETLNSPTPCSSTFRPLSWWPGSKGHTLLLLAIWGGASSLCWWIIGQIGALSIPVISAPANELQAAWWGVSA